MDADADSSLTMDTDDQLDIRLGGTDVVVITTATVDINGLKLDLDADADTSIHASTDDQIDYEISGADDFRMTANLFAALSGSQIQQVNGIFALGASTTHANMTLGAIFDQAGADDLLVAGKSTGDIATGLTTAPTQTVETADYFSLSKGSAANGGLLVQALGEDASQSAVLTMAAWGGQANTTKSTAGVGLINFEASEHNGANTIANITANGNIVSMRAQVGASMIARWLADEDGDTWQAGDITAVNITASAALNGASISLTSAAGIAGTGISNNSGVLDFGADFTSGELAIGGVDALTTSAHGLGVVPSLFTATARCDSADGNFAENDEIPATTMRGTSDAGVSIYADATNVYIAEGTTGLSVLDRTTFNAVILTAANWKWVVRAWI
ncbi:MAG: hypothetical protein GY906_24040 [bacterium]|nr:hypothetical protein [bacterium]